MHEWGRIYTVHSIVAVHNFVGTNNADTYLHGLSRGNQESLSTFNVLDSRIRNVLLSPCMYKSGQLQPLQKKNARQREAGQAMTASSVNTTRVRAAMSINGND